VIILCDFRLIKNPLLIEKLHRVKADKQKVSGFREKRFETLKPPVELQPPITANNFKMVITDHPRG